MRVGQVRIVFTLPQATIDSLFPPNIRPPVHLAYVEWFSRFTSMPEDNCKMYRVKRVLKDGGRLASVVPVSFIQRSVHLFPRWGGPVPADWTSSNVLDESPSFLVNCFKDPHTYFNVY